MSLGLVRGTGTCVGLTPGLLLQAQPGLGGGKASAGWAMVYLGEAPYVPAFGGLGLKGSVLRTWGSPRGLETGETFAGPEVDITLLWAKVSAGVMQRIGGSGGERRTIFVWGVGAGF